MDGIETVFSRQDMTFEEAVDYFKGRVPVTADVFYKIAEQYRGLAFTVSGYTKAQILKRFYDELLAALEDGNTLSEFRSRMNEFLKGEGYEGLDPLQADLIFRTNIQTAYNVGHYEQMTDPGVMKLRPTGNMTPSTTPTPARAISLWTGGYSRQTIPSGTPGSPRTALDAAAPCEPSRSGKSKPGGSRSRTSSRRSLPTPTSAPTRRRCNSPPTSKATPRRS